MILTADLLNFVGEKAKTFEIVVQLGAVLAVVVLYWRKLIDILRVGFGRRGSQSRLNLIHIGLAMLPAVVIGLALHSTIKKYLFGPSTVLISLIVGGLLLIVAEKVKRAITADTVDQITYKQALGIGFFNAWLSGRASPVQALPYLEECCLVRAKRRQLNSLFSFPSR